MMRCIAPSRFAWPDVEKESGGGKSIGPKPGGHVCMEKQHTNTLIEGAKNTFSTSGWDVYGHVRPIMVSRVERRCLIARLSNSFLLYV